MKEFKIIPLNDSNIDTFLALLEERGFSNNEANRYIYGQLDIYGGFLAFNAEVPIGCIGYVCRKINNTGKNILWFNDWYVKPNMRGHNIGSKLIAEVLSVYGSACGIVTPLKSQKVAEKLFDSVFHFCELTLPISPLKYGYQRYLRNNKYNDTILKRCSRSFIYFIKWQKASKIINQRKKKAINLEYITDEKENFNISIHNKQTHLLQYDNNILKAIYSVTNNNNNVKFWKATWENKLAIGMNRITNNTQIESVVLYFSCPDKGGEIELISNLYTYFNTINFCNQISILIPDTIKNKLKIDDVFCKHTPLFITSKYLPDVFFIYNMDKDSSWR